LTIGLLDEPERVKWELGFAHFGHWAIGENLVEWDWGILKHRLGAGIWEMGFILLSGPSTNLQH